MPPVNVAGFGVVNFPDTMNEEQIAQAIERDIVPQIKPKAAGPSAEELAAGRQEALKDTQDAPVLGIPRSVLRKAAIASPAARFLDLAASPNVGRGAMDVIQGGKQLYKHVTGAPDAKQYGEDVSHEIQDYESARGPEAGFDAGRLAGNVGATSFLGLARAPAAAGAFLKYGSTALQGAAAAALNPVDETKGGFAGQKTLQTGIGAAVAPLAQFGLEKAGGFIANKGRQVGDFLATTLRKVRGQPANENAVIDAAGNLTEAGKKAVEKLGIDWAQVGDDAKAGLLKLANDSTKAGRAMNAEEQIRATLMKEVTGEDATLGQVTRDYAQQQTEHDLKKVNAVGAPIRARFAKQNRGLIGKIDELTQKAGGTAIDEYEVGSRVANSVKSADKEAREAVSMLYKQIDQDMGGKFKIQPSKLLQQLDELGDNAEADVISESVKRRLNRIGVLKPDGAGVTLNAKQAEELRKFVGGLSGDSPTKKRAIGILIDSLDDDVRKSAGEDVYEIARKTAKVRFEDLRIPAIKAITEGDVRAEDIFDKYVRKGGIDDLNALKGYMSRNGEDAHQLTPAWNELRSEALKHVFSESTKNSAKNELDDVLFSGPMFKKALDKLGRRKLEVLFSPEELAQLDKVAKVAEWRTPMADVLNTSNTNSAWWNMVDRVLSYLPGKSGMVARGVGRAAKVGADEIAQEAAAKSAMSPAETLAAKVEAEAAERTAGTVRDAAGATRAPSFFSMGAERKRNK